VSASACACGMRDVHGVRVLVRVLVRVVCVRMREYSIPQLLRATRNPN
jgi:hypothetical protein